MKNLDPKRFDCHLVDSQTGRHLKTKKAVEISDECKGLKLKNKAILLFTKAKRGRIVQMLDPYPGKNYGMCIHFFVDELEKQMSVRPMDDTFGVWSTLWGFTKKDLKRRIEELAPAA